MPVVREALLARIGELLEREARIQSHLRHQDGRLELDDPDRAQVNANDQVLEHLDDATRAEVGELRAAIRRLDRGTYGICVTCGDKIEAGRLAALPTAMQCVDCAKASSRAA
jgi:DnaK suppressor protein